MIGTPQELLGMVKQKFQHRAEDKGVVEFPCVGEDCFLQQIEAVKLFIPACCQCTLDNNENY